MELVCKPLMNGIMAYWDEVENTASYTISLYINDQVISRRINDRNEMYVTFNGLAAVDGVTKGAFSSLAGTVASAGRHVVGASYSRPQPTHSGMDYYVQVEAEDRSGNIIETSEKVKCAVREF